MSYSNMIREWRFKKKVLKNRWISPIISNKFDICLSEIGGRNRWEIGRYFVKKVGVSRCVVHTKRFSPCRWLSAAVGGKNRLVLIGLALVRMVYLQATVLSTKPVKCDAFHSCYHRTFTISSIKQK